MSSPPASVTGVEDADDGEPAVAEPDARAGVVDPERARRPRRRARPPGSAPVAALRNVPRRSVAPTRLAQRRVGGGDGDAAGLGLVDERAAPHGRPGHDRGRGHRLARRSTRRSIGAAEARGSTASSPRNDCPGATRSRLVPSWSSCASRSAFEDSEMPSTATIEATPIAIPSAESAARARRVRRPSAPVRRTSAAVIASSPSRSSTRRGKAAAIVVVVGDRDDRRAGRVQRLQQREDVRAGAAVEVAGRLVGEQDRRPPDERAGDRDPLALAARELRGRVRQPVREADVVERLARPRPPLRSGRRRCRAARWRRCRARSSRRAGRTAGRRTRSPCARSAASARSPSFAVSSPATWTSPADWRSSVPITCSSVDLPRARRPDHGDGLTLAHRQRDAAQRLDAAGIGLVDGVQAQDLGGHCAVTTFWPSRRPSPSTSTMSSAYSPGVTRTMPPPLASSTA